MMKIIPNKIINDIEIIHTRLDAIVTLIMHRSTENALYGDLLDHEATIRWLEVEFRDLYDSIKECEDYDEDEEENKDYKIEELENEIEELKEYKKYKILYEELTNKPDF